MASPTWRRRRLRSLFASNSAWRGSRAGAGAAAGVSRRAVSSMICPGPPFYRLQARNRSPPSERPKRLAGATRGNITPATRHGAGSPMQTILVANPQGGSGKTTVATHVAGWLAGKRQRVALADHDPQRSATEWLARRPALVPAVLSLPPGGGKKKPKGAGS